MRRKGETRRQQFDSLRGQLESERSSFMPHWRDLSDYILSRRIRTTTSDANKGDRRNQKIIDSTATLASRTLRSGMMSGITSPARSWFRLTTTDPQFAESGPVKSWLHTVSQEMSSIFHRSNLYNVLPTVYGDMGTFGIGALFVDEDFDTGIRCYSFPIGSYMIGLDEFLRVGLFMRDFRMTVRQLVNKFALGEDGKIDWTVLSTQVKNLWESNQTEAWIDVCHVIIPNDEWDKNKIESKYKKFLSCYYERASGSGDEDVYLSEKGYDYFPVLAPRWETTGEDVYGTDCPGMTALGDIKALQLMQKRKSQAVEKMVNPPMVASPSMRNQPSTILPGGVTYAPSDGDRSSFRPAHEINPRIQELTMDIQDIRQNIRRAYYEDLFLMLANSDRRQITAREIDERHEEKLLAVGPVLEQINQDLLDPLIDATFDIMVAQERIPPPPEELQGLKLKVEYLSIMANAQKLTNVGGMDRFLQIVGQIATLSPTSLDKVDADQAIDIYGDVLSMPPGIIRPDADVEKIRSGRADAAQAQAEQEQAQQSAMAAKTLSETKMDGDSALSQMMAANQGAVA